MNFSVEKKHGKVKTQVICEDCKEEFIDQSSKERHPCPVRLMATQELENVFSDENEQFTCPKCFELFDQMEDLKVHYMKNHVIYVKNLGGKPKKPKKESSDLNATLEGIIDAGDGSFLCDQCPFIGSREDLIWHVKQIHKNRYVTDSSNMTERLILTQI